MEENLISIVLPTYNGAKYICEAIESILSQTYTKWELIIVDDCSTDKTLQIINTYAQNESRIKILHHEKNSKLPGALNTGFSISKGRLLTWTSDDNRFLPNALETMQEYFLQHSDLHMLCAGMYEIDANGGRRREFMFQSEESLCIENNVGACFMYTREVYEQVGDFDIDLFCVEDHDYWIRVEIKYGKILRIPDILYEYRVHDKSLSGRKRDYINRQITLLRNKHLDYIWQCVKQDKMLLFQVYIDSLDKGCEASFLANIVNYIPELQSEMAVKNNTKKYIIFGAGEYGERAWAALQDKAFCFTDNDSSKVGAVKNGLRVVSAEKAISMADDYYFIVAVSSLYGYEIIRQLRGRGITNYCTYQYYIWINRSDSD